MNPDDSIDGLGFTFNDLSKKNRERALFMLMRRVERSNLTVEQREAISQALSKAKTLSDKNQAALRDLLNTPAQ